MSGHEQQTAPPPGSDAREHASEENEDIEPPGLDLQSLSRAVKARKADYTHRRSIRVKIGTWNVAAISGTEKDIGKWFVQGQGLCEEFSGLKGSQFRRNVTPDGSSTPSDGDDQKKDGSEAAPFQCSPEEVDLYVLGLQEIVDVSSPTEALRPYTDPGPANRWKEAVHQALPPGYQLVSEVQLLGLFLTIYASPAIRDSISSISSTYAGTGLMGYMGNKGAVATRMVLGETTRLVFVNCHLAAGSDKSSLERRNWDAMQITQRVKFEPVESEDKLQEDQGDSIGDEDFTFWFGDLNYRLDDIPGDDVRQVLARHTENKYDAALQGKRTSKSSSRRNSDASSSSSEDKPSLPEGEELPEPVTDDEIDPLNDPASLQTTISSLITHDQLRIQQKKGTAFHKGWREGQISFLPTYKYDVGSVALFDTSEKHRGPSWCDRILYRTRRDKLKHEQLDREAEEARKRDKEMQARGLDKAVADDNVLFDYDPEVDGQDGSVEGEGYDSDADGEEEEAPAESEDAPPESIHQHYYVSHQGILSSDHKPLDTIFTLTFDAVNPSLKAKVHQEVVRELDKAENEARPGLTVVVDTHADEDRSQRDPNTVDFGEIRYDVPVHRSLTVANTSGAPATFSFAERPNLGDEKQDDVPLWLDVHVQHQSDHEPASGESSKPGSTHTLHPGEVANIDVTAHVRSITHVRLLNLKKAKLEEILVLQVDSGRDHFITACGKWLPTCFGCSVDELTRMPEEGARHLNGDGVSHREKDANEVRLSAPRELFRLTESISELTERAIAEWSMTKGESEKDQAPWTKEPGGSSWPFQPDTWILTDAHERAPLLSSVRESLDTNGSLSSIFAPEVSSLYRLEILAETLLTFLNSLSDGIITASVWQQMEPHMITREKAKSPSLSWEETQAWVLESLAYSPAHSVSFTFVTFMLARIANEVAPVPSTTKSNPSTSNTKKQNGSADKSTDSSTSQEPDSSSDTTSPTAPTPASAAAFISGGSFRRKARSLESDFASSSAANATARRQAVEAALAGIFARVLISAAVPVPAKEKERRASEERRKSIIEPFLKMIGVDERGPSGGR